MRDQVKLILPYAGLPLICGGWLALNWTALTPIVLLLGVILLVFGYLASVGDIREKRIPNQLVGAMAGIWVLVMVPQLFFSTDTAVGLLLSGLAGAVLSGALFLVVYLVSRKGLGGGDVKFMAASGLYLGFAGVLPAMLYGSVLAGLTGLVLILAKKLGPRDTLPLAPFLYVGMVLTLFIR